MQNLFEGTTNSLGHLTIVKTDGLTGETQTQIVPNIITTVGKTYIAQRMKGVTGTTAAVTSMSHMAIGTGAVATNVADVHMGGLVGVSTTEVVVTPNSVYPTSSRPVLTGSTGTANVITYTATFGPGANSSSPTVAVTEAGIFDSATRDAGNMLCRTVFGVVTKTYLDTITITWTVTVN